MAGDVPRAYERLIQRARELKVLASCSALLEWDEQTYMPMGGSTHRAEQLGHLAGLHHERATDPQIGDMLAIVESSDLAADPDADSAVNIREIRRSYDRFSKLPRDLAEALARTTSLAQQEWIAARHDSSFGRFRPWLDRILHLKREEGTCLSSTLSDGSKASGPNDDGNFVYDPLLDEYEPGARSAELAVLFAALRDELVPLAQTIADASTKRSRDEGGFAGGTAGHGDAILKRVYPLERQKFFGEAVASSVGFDFQKGRLDVTAHPFCTGIGPGDTRITTRYDEHQFGDAFFGILHEVGHALYEQGLPGKHFGTPIGAAVSMGVHESQSRLWENAVGRSRAFWTYWFPLASRVFHQALHDVDLDRFLIAINNVAPTSIRVQADEVTYNLHIIVRFELEMAMLNDQIATSDLPDAWRQKYAELLCISPSSDAEGCLQDIHWSAGLFGYFPTYTLGNLYAAQLFDKARTDLSNLDSSFARGDFGELLHWLRHNVHRHGQRYRPVPLIERATGAKLDHRCLIAALKHKYGELYGI
jgi:carboxypeptidase Taq